MLKSSYELTEAAQALLTKINNTRDTVNGGVVKGAGVVLTVVAGCLGVVVGATQAVTNAAAHVAEKIVVGHDIRAQKRAIRKLQEAHLKAERLEEEAAGLRAFVAQAQTAFGPGV
jgi:hypothetical protein